MRFSRRRGALFHDKEDRGALCVLIRGQCADGPEWRAKEWCRYRQAAIRCRNSLNSPPRRSIDLQVHFAGDLLVELQLSAQERIEFARDEAGRVQSDLGDGVLNDFTSFFVLKKQDFYEHIHTPLMPVMIKIKNGNVESYRYITP